MRELSGKEQRVTHLLNKGNFLDPGEEVSPGTPVAFNAFPAGAPHNRLGLAAWLTASDNPLTARVAVNRFWAQLMGQAIVQTEEDFGTQGTLPENQPLLDWLAVSFQSPKPAAGSPIDPLNPQLCWDFKGLIKLIANSAAYRQSSAVSPELLRQDPLNKLYSRAPRRRLDAETVRDQALALSGLLSRKLGGPSVYPLQPDGLWRAAFNGERSWSTSTGEDRYRRGIYTFWRRTVPYPSMATFDAPSRETCTLRRQPTNTPLQAFVTLNDPVFVEAAQALALRVQAVPDTRRVDRLWELCLSRTPSPRERDWVTSYLKSQGSAERAWTALASVLLNLDEFITRE